MYRLLSRRIGLLCVCAVFVLVAGCARQPSVGRRMSHPKVHTEKGLASWYGGKFHGRRTASGARFNTHALTAAHRTLPFGTRVEVTNLSNKKRVEVVINDRGPFARRRVIDVSHAAARQLDMIRSGVAPVRLEVVEDYDDSNVRTSR